MWTSVHTSSHFVPSFTPLSIQKSSRASPNFQRACAQSLSFVRDWRQSKSFCLIKFHSPCSQPPPSKGTSIHHPATKYQSSYPPTFGGALRGHPNHLHPLSPSSILPFALVTLPAKALAPPSLVNDYSVVHEAGLHHAIIPRSSTPCDPRATRDCHAHSLETGSPCETQQKGRLRCEISILICCVFQCHFPLIDHLRQLRLQ